MEILVGDVHGSLKQFLYPFYANGFYDSFTIKNNEIIFEHLDLHGSRIIFIGDIFYKGNADCIIANTLSRMILNNEGNGKIEWILGNRDLLPFAKVFDDSIELNPSAHSWRDSPFNSSRRPFNLSHETFKGSSLKNSQKKSKKSFKNLSRSIQTDFEGGFPGDSRCDFEKLNRSRMKRLITEKKIKVVTRLKNNMLVSHAPLNQESLDELKEILDNGFFTNINPDLDLKKLPDRMKIKTGNQFDSIDDLNQIFTDSENINLFCSFLKMFWNKHVFEAVEESVVGHEVFINEYPKEAIEKVQKYGNWLTDEYISMNILSNSDRMKQFSLTEVHFQGSSIKTNLHHIDCNGSKNPCYFALVSKSSERLERSETEKTDSEKTSKSSEKTEKTETSSEKLKWIFNGSPDDQFHFESFEFNGRKWKVLSF